ncbi:MAG: glycosyltransferase [Candidatus Binatia bacterium]
MSTLGPTARPVPLNVAHCIHGLGLGGAQQIIKYIVHGSDRQIFRHHVYSCSDGVFRGEIEALGATVRIIERRLPKFDPFWAAALARAMQRDAIDVVHTHLFGDSLHGVLAARRLGGLPVVVTLHIGPEGQSRLQRLGYRWVLAHSAYNVGCTESVGRAWARLVGVPIEVVSNGIEAPSCEPPDAAVSAGMKRQLGIDPETFVVGAVGRLVAQKGYHHLISAFADVCRRSTISPRLVLVGDGPLRADLQRQAQREGISDLVLFTGVRSDVPRLLGAFDVLVFSSGYEGLPIALLEGMAAARCIIGTDAPGILDGVRDQQEALIVPIGDAGRLCAALMQVSADGALRRRLGDAARRRFVREFTAQRMVSSYERVYQHIVEAAHSANGRVTVDRVWIKRDEPQMPFSRLPVEHPTEPGAF